MWLLRAFHGSSRAVPPAWSCWARSSWSNVRMPRAGAGRGSVASPSAGMGHVDRVSIAVVAGLPRASRALAWPSMDPAGGTRDREVLLPLTGLSWPLQTVPCRHQRLFLVSQREQHSLFLGWEPPQGRCVQCLAGHRSSCVQLTPLECPHLPEPPPTAAPSPVPSCGLSRTPLEGAGGWKGCCFLGSCCSPSAARAWHWLNVPLQSGQERQSCCPAFYSALNSRI